MKKYIYFLFAIFMAACAKDAVWNQDSEIPASRKGTIVGQLVNDDNNQPLKGIKILFERQTQKDGSNSFVDTVSTDSEGKFSYAVPFPNKVRLVVRDTGRYQADTAVVEVLEHTDYNIIMNSHPRFGVSQINVQVVDENQQPYEGIRIGLYERETSTESYSAVDTLVSDAQGRVSFVDRAFPVRYQVRIVESDLAYELDSLEGALLTKDPVNLILKTRAMFGTGDLKLRSYHKLSKRVVKNEKFEYRYKSVKDANFSVWQEGEFGVDGQFTIANTLYPGDIEIRYNSNSKVKFEVQKGTMTLSELNTTTPFTVEINDLEPRYVEPVVTNLKVSTLVLNNGLSVKGPFAITMDNKRNLYIADGYKNQLFMVDATGNTSIIAGTGAVGNVDGVGTAATFNGMWGVAVDSSGTIYTTDAANATGAHRIRKIVKNGDGSYTVSTIAGTGTAGGNDGPGASATFNRPSGIIFDKGRNCLYVSEWGAGRIRKIDFSTSANTVSTLATLTGAGNLFTMALSPDHQDLYVSSNNNSNIFKYDFDSNTIGSYQSSGVNNRGLFVSGNKLLATAGNQHLIFYYDLKTGEKTNLSTATSSGDVTGIVIEDVPILDPAARFFQPFGIYYDIWTGDWYVSNNTNNSSNIGSVRIIRSDDI